MKFKGTIIAGASGSMEGLTFSHNRGGSYIRARTNPVQPNTLFQQFIKGLFSILSGQWRALSVARREGWTTYAINSPITGVTGDPLVLTGHQMFIRCNTARFQAGSQFEVDPPTTFGLTSLEPPDLVVTAPNSISIDFEDADEWANEAGGLLLVYASRPVGQTTNYFKGPFRFAGVIAGATPIPPTTPHVINSPFTYSAGQKVFVRVIASAGDSRPSTSLIRTAIVA